jgi:hypothetical protein
MNDVSPGPQTGFSTGFEPGSVISGYRLEKQIGSGGMSMIFLARDERLQRQVAVKALAPALASDESFRQRFIRESRAAAAVDDPHIIPVYEAGEAGGVLYIAMRYVAGPPAVAAGVAYAVSQDRKLTAFRAATGSVLWTHPADPRVTPVVSSAVVYAGDPSGGLLALRARDGKPLWAAPQPFRTGPVVAGGSVYVSNGVAVWALAA